MAQLYDLSGLGADSAPAPKNPMPAQHQSTEDQISGFLGQVADGTTFGLADELGGGLGAVGRYIKEKANGNQTYTIGQAYTDSLAEARRRPNQFREEHPALALGANIGGTLLGPGKLIKGAKTVLGAAGIATAEGAVYGFNSGEGEDSRLENAAVGGALGYITGGAFKGVAGALASRRAARAVVKANALNTAEKAAQERIATREVAAAAAAQPAAEAGAAEGGTAAATPRPKMDATGQGILPGFERGGEAELTNEQRVARAREEVKLLSPEDAQKVLDTSKQYDPAKVMSDLNANLIRFNWKDLDDPEKAQSLIGSVQGVFAEVHKRFPTNREAGDYLRTLSDELGTDYSELEHYHAATKNLPAYADAARAVVGGHAAHLSELATKYDALRAAQPAGSDEVISAADDLWRATDRQAMIQAVVGGASSNVGRTLASFRRSIAVGQDGEHEAIREALAKGKMDAPPGTTGDAVRNAGIEALRDNTARLARLIMQSGGDVAKVNKLAERLLQGNGRLSSISREATGNLFSPTTGLINTLSSGAHLIMRGTQLATAAGISKLRGDQASALINSAAASAYAQGTVAGLRAGFSKSLWTVAGGLAKEGMRVTDTVDPLRQSWLASSLSDIERQSMTAREAFGLDPLEFLRRDIARSPAIHIDNIDMQRLNGWIDQNGGWLRFPLRVLTTSGALTVNTAGAISRAATEMFIRAPDDLTGTIAYEAGRRARAAEMAMGKGIGAGLTGDNLQAFVKQEEQRLLTGGATASEQHAIVEASGIHEGKIVAFQEDLDGGWKAVTNAAYTIDPLGIVFPFVQTPLNILKRSVVDYTPLGALRREARLAMIGSDGVKRDRALADLALSTSGMAIAYGLASQGVLKGPDGGFASMHRLDGTDMFSVNIAGHTVEFNRMDPVGFMLGFAATVHEFLDVASHFDDVNQEDLGDKGQQMFSAAVSAALGYTLSKSYLVSLQDMAELGTRASRADWKGSGKLIGKDIAQYAERFIPASATGRYLDRMFTGQAAVATMFSDRVARDIIGLPDVPRTDWLGDIAKLSWFDRLTGIHGGPLSDDPLHRKLAEESFSCQMPARVQDGVQLTSEQYFNFLRIQRLEAVDPASGQTFREALSDYALGGEWDLANSFQRAAKLSQLSERYTRLAKDELEFRDADFARKRNAALARKYALKAGSSDEQANTEAHSFLDAPATPAVSDQELAELAKGLQD